MITHPPHSGSISCLISVLQDNFRNLFRHWGALRGGGRTSFHPKCQEIQASCSPIGVILSRFEGNKSLIVSENSLSIMRKIPFLVFSIIVLLAGFCPPAAATTHMSYVCDCSGDLYNCADFSTTSKAQSCYDYCIYLGNGDVHRLDADHDSLACEAGTAKTSSTNSYTSSGSGSSGGCPAGKCYVNGYYRKSGTYVHGYCRKC